MNLSEITITSLETINAFDVVTGNFLFALDELQSATIAQTQDKTDITGKQGRRLNSLKRNKAVTISGNNGMVSGGLLELQTGGKFENRTTPVMWADYMTVIANTAQTSFKATGTVGNEIESLYVKNSDGTLGKILTQDSAVGEGKYTYDPATKKIMFAPGEVADGTEVVAYYLRQIQADVLDNMSDTYSGKATLYIDAFAEDKCSNVYRVQFYVPKADFNGEFSFEMGDNQTVHAFEAESLAGSGCGAHNASGMLWTYTIFGANSEDVVTGADNMKVPNGDAKPGNIDGKKVSDLIGDDVFVSWNGIDGTVNGTLKMVEGWTEFNGSVKAEQSGHFFPVVLDSKYAGKEITVIGTKTKKAVDTEWVVRVDNCKKFTFQCDGETILTLDLSKAILATA